MFGSKGVAVTIVSASRICFLSPVLVMTSPLPVVSSCPTSGIMVAPYSSSQSIRNGLTSISSGPSSIWAAVSTMVTLSGIAAAILAERISRVTGYWQDVVLCLALALWREERSLLYLLQWEACCQTEC